MRYHVIIRHENKPDHLRRLIDQLANQRTDARPVDVTVFDNASRASLQVVELRVKQLPWVDLLKLERRHKAADLWQLWNRMLRAGSKSSAGLVVFLDATSQIAANFFDLLEAYWPSVAGPNTAALHLVADDRHQAGEFSETDLPLSQFVCAAPFFSAAGVLSNADQPRLAMTQTIIGRGFKLWSPSNSMIRSATVAEPLATAKPAQQPASPSQAQANPKSTAGSDAVLWRNGIGNFVLATPFLRNLNNPTIFMPKDEPRFAAIKDISIWPVEPLSAFTDRFARVFSMWCFRAADIPKCRNLITQSAPKWAAGEYEPDTYLRLIPGAKSLPPTVRTTRAWTLYVGKNENLVALANGSNGGLRHKMWPDAYWPDLCERILAKRPNTQFVYVGSKSERPLGDAIMKRVGRRCWNFAGLLSLSGTADMLQQCGRMICNDTGLLHVADAVGCRVVSIWGPTFFTKNEPLNSKASGRTVAVRSDGGGCPHFPCLHKPEMSRCKNPICIAAVTVDRVLEACDNGI